jgi:tetratricopeptide (TPR) repeat protein
MSTELFEIPVSLLHRDDEAPELLRALVPYDAHKYAEALEPLEKVARGGNVLAIFKYANTLSNLGYEEPAEHFWRISIDAGHTDSCNNLANLLKRQGRMDEVRPLYERAAAAGAPDALFNIGLLIQEDDPEASEQWFLKAIEAGHGKACANLALKYFDEGRIEEAFKFAELGISRGDFFSAAAIAVYHQRREEWDEVIKASRRALTLADDSNVDYQGNAYDFIALGSIMLARFDDAEVAIQDCIAHNSPQKDTLIDLLKTAREGFAESQPSPAPKFCPGCGTPVAEGNAFCTACGRQLQTTNNLNVLPSVSNSETPPSNAFTNLTKTKGGLGVGLPVAQQDIVVTQKISGNTFGDFESYLDNCEEVITPYLNGAISIDGGMLAISGTALPSCESCYGYNSNAPQFNCPDCGRTTDNYLHVRAGDGDGIYMNYDLFWGNYCGGTITVLDEGNSFASEVYNLLDEIRNNDKPYNQTMAQFWNLIHASEKNLELQYFGQIQSEFDGRWSSVENPYGSLYFGDTGEGIDSLKSVIYSKNMPIDKHLVYGFCERNEKDVLIPRFVLTLREQVATKLGMPTANPNLLKEHEIWQDAGVFASMGGRLPELAAQINVAAELAVLENPDLDQATITDHQTQLFSWFILQHYQGSLEPNMMAHLKDLTVQMVKVYLRYRTCFGLADKLTSWPPSTNKLGV